MPSINLVIISFPFLFIQEVNIYWGLIHVSASDLKQWNEHRFALKALTSYILQLVFLYLFFLLSFTSYYHCFLYLFFLLSFTAYGEDGRQEKILCDWYSALWEKGVGMFISVLMGKENTCN